MRDEIANPAGPQDMNEDEGWDLSQLTDIAWSYLDEPPNWETRPLGGSHGMNKNPRISPEVSKAMLMINFLPSWERQLLRSPVTNCALVQGSRALRVQWRIFRQNWSGTS